MNIIQARSDQTGVMVDGLWQPCCGCIPWYMLDRRFEPGTVADVGDVRLTLGRTDRKKNNRWRLYLEIRIRKEYGVGDDLKRAVCVAEFDGALSLAQAQQQASDYFVDSISRTVFALRRFDDVR